MGLQRQTGPCGTQGLLQPGGCLVTCSCSYHVDEAAFEEVWRGRATRLGEMKGFIDFHLLRGPEAEDHTLYASHTIWSSREDFEAWTRSEAFRQAHRNAGDNKQLYLGHPRFEGFEVVQTVKRDTTSAAESA